MKTQHTPGPWRISDDGNDVEQGYADNAGICTLFAVSEEQDKANAKLIAAAPELLEACQTLIEANKRMAQWIVNHEQGAQAFTGMEAHLQGINAIKKATS